VYVYPYLDQVEREWSIYRLSDGQRRRVQLLMGLARKSELLLLDEVTTDLDVYARHNLLAFLKQESEERGVTIIYATHIFDGLENWATDVVFLTNGKIDISSPLSELEALQELRAKKVPAPLFRLVEVWLRKEFNEQMAAKKASGAVKGFDKDKDLAAFGSAERTMNTGFSRGATIPTPNLSANPEPERPQTQAQKDRHEWQMKHSGIYVCLRIQQVQHSSSAHPFPQRSACPAWMLRCYGVAATSRLFKMIGLFCKRDL